MRQFLYPVLPLLRRNIVYICTPYSPYTFPMSTSTCPMSTSTCPSASASQTPLESPAGSTMIEVERKFVIDQVTETRILDLAKTHKVSQKEKTFTDVYYDTKDNTLTVADHWLRQRCGRWQLKYPPPTRVVSQGVQYVEIDGDSPAILNRLRQVVTGDIDQTNLEDFVLHSGLLEPFGTIITTRRSFHLPGEVAPSDDHLCGDGFQVDLDSADFGFTVGEIEILVSDDKNVPAALAQIDELADNLGISSDGGRVPGKLDEFLRRFRPDHYRTLVNAGRLVKRHEDGLA